MNEIERILPPEDAVQSPLDEGVLAGYFEEAFSNLLPYVIRGMTSSGVRTIYRPTENGFSSILVSLPNRYSRSFWDALEQAWSDNATARLTNYLWRCGTPRITLSGENPDQKSWSYWVLTQHIINPLYNRLIDAMNEQMVLDGVLSEPWISETALHELAQRVSRQWANNTTRVTASFFSKNLEVSGVESVQLGNGFSARVLNTNELCLYLTKHAEKILWEETFGSAFANNLVQIAFDVPRSTPSTDVLDRVTKRLNVLRLAASALEPASISAGEGLVLVRVEDPALTPQVHRLHRDEVSGWTPLVVDSSNRTVLVERLHSTLHWSNELTDVERAIWRFGRSAVANTSADRITEAVIGLEALLVPGPHELRYRFSLHGASLLANDTEEPLAIFKELNGLYDLRSRSVHGQSSNKTAEAAPRALTRLAQAINSVIQLYEKGILSEKRVAEGIQKCFLANLGRLKGTPPGTPEAPS